jgi:hypothetical protein
MIKEDQMLIEPRIFDAIRDNKITELDFFGQNLTDIESIKLACLLEDNTSVKFLNVEYNKLGPKVGLALAQMLSRNQTLQQLNVRDNQLGETSVRAIMKALQFNNNSLLRLDIKGNTPEHINVQQISINDLNKQNKITKYLDRNKALKFFDNLKQDNVDQSDLLFWNSKVKTGGADYKKIKVPHTIAKLLKEIPPQLKESKSEGEIAQSIQRVLKEPSGSWTTFFGNTSLHRSELLQKLKTNAVSKDESVKEQPEYIPLVEI